MDLSLTESERMAAEVARKALDELVTTERLAAAEASESGLDADLWTRLAPLGWGSMMVPALAGGGGAGFLETGLVLEEIGRSGLGSPVAGTTMAAALLARVDGSGRDPATALLRRVADGADVCVVGVEPEAAPFVAHRGADGVLRVEGGPEAVPWAHRADALLVLARMGDATAVCLADPRADGVDVRPARSLDNERLGVVRLTAVAVGEPLALLPGDGERDEWLSPYRALHAALVLGGARRILEMTVDYMSTRRQFGRALGSLPTVQQACADIAIEVDGATLAVHDALSRLDLGVPATATAAVAAYWTGVAAQNAAVRAAQLHGAIGFMKEYHFQYFFRRAKAGQLRLGSLRRQRDLLARVLLPAVASGGGQLWTEGPEPVLEVAHGD